VVASWHKWKFFLGSCILAAGLLRTAGAPLGPILIGFVVCGLVTWRRH
jgi:hypothetical protein